MKCSAVQCSIVQYSAEMQYSVVRCNVTPLERPRLCQRAGEGRGRAGWSLTSLLKLARQDGSYCQHPVLKQPFLLDKSLCQSAIPPPTSAQKYPVSHKAAATSNRVENLYTNIFSSGDVAHFMGHKQIIAKQQNTRNSYTIINRPGVAGAVLQTPSSLVH